MTDFSNPEDVSLQQLKERIASTDLVPSRNELLQDIDSKFEIIEKNGVRTWADLSKALKNPKALASFAQLTGISTQYLTLLRREIESYLQKPFAMKEITWVQRDVIEKLAKIGVSDSTSLCRQGKEEEGILVLAKKVDVEPQQVRYLMQLADLTRIQWVNLNFARMLIEAGYENSKKVALADPDALCEGLVRINEGGKYFNGKIGLRDIKRLIQAAGYVKYPCQIRMNYGLCKP